MGLGLLRRASIYREKFLNKPKKGLLKRALEYLEKLDNNYPETVSGNSSNNSESVVNISLDESLIEEQDTAIKDIDTEFDEKYEQFELQELENRIEQKTNETNEAKNNEDKLQEMNIEDLQMELMEDLSKIENIQEPESPSDLEEDVAELEEVNILEEEIENFNIENFNNEEKESSFEQELKEEETLLEEVISEEDIKNNESEIASVEELEEIKEEENHNKILEKVKEENLNEATKVKFLENEAFPKDKDFNKRYYYGILNKISKDFSTLVLKTDSYKDFLDIISNNFNISKSALLVYSPQKQRFICWYAKGLDSESCNKLNFDLNYGDIYKNIAKEKSYFIKPNDSDFEKIESLLSSNDKNNSDFQLWTPFIFSARIIGILLSLQLYNRDIPNIDFLEALEIIGRLNGPLLYNLLQHYNIALQKKNEITDENKDLQEINENEKKSIDVEVINRLEAEKSDKDKIDTIDIKEEEISIEEIFPQKYHKLIYFTEQRLKENPNSFISFIGIKVINKEELESNIPNFNASTFLSDIQFIGMNVAGTKSFLQVYDDLSMYIVLPEVKKSIAVNTTKVICDEIKMMFNEIFSNTNIEFKTKTLSFPEDSNNYIDIFNKLLNI